MPEEVKKGDVVCLKSDPSFKMTAGGTLNGHLNCYYVKDGKIEVHSIYQSALMLYKATPTVDPEPEGVAIDIK